MGYFRNYIKNDDCSKSIITFINIRDIGNYRIILRKLKEPSFNCVLIPETPLLRPSQNFFSDLLGAQIAFPGAIKKFIRFSDSIVSIIPDFGKGLNNIQFHSEIAERFHDDETVLNHIVKNYERFVFIKPYLFIPFEYNEIWKGLFSSQNLDKDTVVQTLVWGKKCLLLLSDGKMFSCLKKDLKSILNSNS
jgi:hypothetical protein